jgi:hypothetical protein
MVVMMMMMMLLLLLLIVMMMMMMLQLQLQLLLYPVTRHPPPQQGPVAITIRQRCKWWPQPPRRLPSPMAATLAFFPLGQRRRRRRRRHHHYRTPSPAHYP